MDGKPPGTTIAPALSGSRLIVGPKEAVIAVLLHGLGGPVDGNRLAIDLFQQPRAVSGLNAGNQRQGSSHLVSLQVTHAPGTDGSNTDPQNAPWTVETDAAGNFTASKASSGHTT